MDPIPAAPFVSGVDPNHFKHHTIKSPSTRVSSLLWGYLTTTTPVIAGWNVQAYGN